MNMNINDLTSLKLNGPALEADLQAVFKKYGLTMESHRGVIGQGEIRLTINLKTGSAEDQEENERKKYEIYHRVLDVPADGFGKTFVGDNGDRFRIIGVQPKKPKNCVKLVRVRDGKRFQCSSHILAGRTLA